MLYVCTKHKIMTTIEGTYYNGHLKLERSFKTKKPVKVTVTFEDESNTKLTLLSTPRPMLLALLIVLAAFISCGKSYDDTTTTKVPKIKTITHGTSPNSDKEYYEYDQTGRLTSITITGHELNHIQYIYLKDKIVMQSEIGITVDTLYLNDKGLVVSEMFGSTTFEYDSKRYCNKTTGYGSGGEVDLELQYKVSDENATVLDVWEIVNEKLVYRHTYNYEFLSHSVNTIGNENMGITFYGKQNKNLLSVSTDRYIGSEYLDQRHYRYEIDAKKRVVKKWPEGYPESGDVYTYFE